MRPQVVILGGGFGGLACARGLRHADVDVKLIDCRNFHLFQPLLYQVATGGLSPANIAAPLRSILRRQPNAPHSMSAVRTGKPFPPTIWWWLPAPLIITLGRMRSGAPRPRG
jgi:NADH dehydrogenase FAD-containing subunit